MEFGKITSEELEEIKFSLPADPIETTRLLENNPRPNSTEIFVGCAKWGRKDWVGTIYPKGTKEADFLSHYARHFNAIELNATFYKMPSQSQAAAWSSNVGSDFKFCPKFSEKISHIKRLQDVQEYTDRFIEGVLAFGKNLGPVFLMPHPSMGAKSLETIELFLETIPKSIQVFIEFRHRDWFKNQDINKKMFDSLERAGVGTIITDAAGRRDCLHMRLTTRTAFIRFQGNGLHHSDYTRVDEWVLKIKSWCDAGIDKVFFFMHQLDEVHSPQLAKYVVQQINKVCGTKLKESEFLN